MLPCQAWQEDARHIHYGCPYCGRVIGYSDFELLGCLVPENIRGAGCFGWSPNVNHLRHHHHPQESTQSLKLLVSQLGMSEQKLPDGEINLLGFQDKNYYNSILKLFDHKCFHCTLILCWVGMTNVTFVVEYGKTSLKLKDRALIFYN